MTKNTKITIGAFVLLSRFIVLTGGFILQFISSNDRPAAAPPAELQGVLMPGFKPIQSFQLTDQNGATFGTSRFTDKWSFVFFGYTSCPDICPATLSVLNSVESILKKAPSQSEPLATPENTQMVFISVDPKRDTIEKLGTYVGHFNKQFIGATAGKEEIDALARQFGAGYIFEPETAPGEYIVTHASAIFLVDPAGRLVAAFSQPHYANIIATQFKKIREYL